MLSDRSDDRTLKLDYWRAKLNAECQLLEVVREVEARAAGAAPAFVLLDVRDRDAHAAGRIPGARSFPASEAATLAAGLDRGPRYVTYCWRSTCHLAARTALILAERGFEVREMNAGWREWLAGGWPVEAGPERDAP